MPETPTFPLHPIDVKFHARLDWSRCATPPEGSPPRPTGPMNAARTAARTLRQYMRRGRPPVVGPGSGSERRGRRPTGPSLLDRLPDPLTPAVCLGVAAGVLALQLAYVVTCRPDVHPRLARHNLLSPVDVKRSLVVSRTPLAAARTLLRTFARRTGWRDGWFT